MIYTAKFDSFKIVEQVDPTGDKHYYVAAVISSGRGEYDFWMGGHSSTLSMARNRIRHTFGKKVKIVFWADRATDYKDVK